MELISIIVPIYNVEKYLIECIETIINQSYKNLEIILVDDGSPDKCGQICDEYAMQDNRIKVIHKENGGLSSARNAGLDIATGEYISFVDSDDYVSVDFIGTLYNLCKKYDADIAECDFVKFTDKVEVQKKDIVVEKYSTIEMQEQIYTENYVKTIVVWNKLYKKYLYENLRFPEGKINEDEFTTYKIFDNSSKNIVVTNEVLYYYRQNENSIMGRKFNVKRLDVLEAFEERKEYYKKKNLNKLYSLTIEEYQNELKQFYILTKKYINNSKKYLNNIQKKAVKNYKEYIMLDDINFSRKIKNAFFVFDPFLYILIVNFKKNLEFKKEEVQKKEYIKKYNEYKKRCLKNKQKEFLIFNTPNHGNLGDHAIIYAENELLKLYDIKSFEISTDDENYCFDYIKENISKDAIISITGGGFIGSQWIREEELVKKVIESFYEHKIIIFPQTFYFKDDYIGKKELEKLKVLFKKCKNIKVFVREKKSYDFVREMYKNIKVILVPDIVLSLNKCSYDFKREDILVCLRNDPESSFTKSMKDEIVERLKKIDIKIRFSDTVVNYSIDASKRERELNKKLKEFAKSKLIVTDRLHGMIFATLTQTPCIVFGNYNQKVKGVYEWIKARDENIIFNENLNNLNIDIKRLIENPKRTNNVSKYNFKELYQELEDIKKL